MYCKILRSLEDVPAPEWDALVGENNPFVEHAFLSLLERSGSVGESSGWIPAHVTIWDEERLIGAAPTYIKDNSYGEYIFDWSWAELSHRMGVSYYPKVVVAVPFTPATGPRLLYHPEANRDEIWEAIVIGLQELVRMADASSFHILFCLDEEAAFLKELGLVRRATHQFHWRNNDYQSFDDFLGALRSQSRKQIRRERRKATQDAGLSIELVRGDQVDDETWRTFFQLYRSTTDRKWGQAYLRRRFFTDAKDTIGHRSLLAIARDQANGEIVAGTLSFAKGKHVYGRYWGAFRDYDGLHFELCYYQLIEFAIANQCSLFEAGAQGTHKIKRGLLPNVTHSIHYFALEQLGSAFRMIMDEERKHIFDEIEDAQCEGPFKEDCLPPGEPVAGFER